MCGIVGAVAQRNVVPILLEGLKRLEYRGYDSAGIAVLNKNNHIKCIRVAGKVERLATALNNHPIKGNTGIAHTRWATHGAPSEQNAHPHVSNDTIALVHNGIIENHNAIRTELTQAGYQFSSETDTEVIVHLIHQNYAATGNFLQSVQSTISQLKGAFALGVINSDNPKQIIAARCGSPLVIGLGIEEFFIASDHMALLPVTNRFIYLEEGDIALITEQGVTILDKDNNKAQRKIYIHAAAHDSADRGRYKHYMQKEIFEQPEAIKNTLQGRINNNTLELANLFDYDAEPIFSNIKRVQIVACGTSFHAGLIAKYWIEEIAHLPCQIEVASEIRYRKTIVQPDTLFVTISQSGETADTLAALRQAKELGYKHSLTICNVPQSSLVRESDLAILTKAGPEIGVASTKAFTTQLTALLMLTITLGRHNGLDSTAEANLVKQLAVLPELTRQVLTLDKMIATLATQFAEKQHCFFLGRGTQYPVAMEGALKLKEISYIHAESYPAGELKHGPLALIDKEMPVIVVAPNNELLEKLISNIHEVRARGGKLFIFADSSVDIPTEDDLVVIKMPQVEHAIAPIIYTVPLQLLAYHVAVLKGTDIDQPRNLAKSVTVE
ncbi:MAG: glutamine--fructose-6-phosphate transaminase (isomerizing) [Gammaproteobacteria bacterium]|nr:glutamine--fructose-6-phosphate transaminase (isomerizing) [Gammaproteobacteria bacterium]